MDAKAYWGQRAEQNARRVYEYADRKAQLATRWFGRARREMERKVRDFYRRYGDGEGISPRAAKAALQDRRALSLTLDEARRLAKLYPEDPEIQRLLRQSYLARAVSREEFLQMQLELLASAAYGEYANETEKSLNEIFEESYYKGIFDYQQFIGSGNPGFNRLSVHQIQAAVETAWKGANYSQRIWGGQRASLARYLNRIISTGMMEGKPNGVMAAELRKAMDMGAYQARRLIRTECAQVCARADMLAYQENETPQYQFLATLDLRTSEICRELDGKVFDVKDGQPGVNMQPMHPFCRSTTVPYIPDAEFDQDATRTARNAAGETYKAPASMTYREWYRKYVEDAKDYRDILEAKWPSQSKADLNLQKRLDGELALLPPSHQKIVEEAVQKIVISNEPSGYAPNHKLLRINRNFSEGHMIHEAGHVIAEELKIYEQDEFRRILRKGFENLKSSDIIWDRETFEKPIYRVFNEKFISEYQGHMYQHVGIWDGKSINLLSMLDYFPEGYREYFINPQNLLKHDPELFYYIKRMVDGAS